MLLSFSLANFRSFQTEQTLSMVASARHADHKEHLHTIPGSPHELLPVAVIYGPNGAGKSNLVKALLFVEKLVLKGNDPKETTGWQPFLLGRDDDANPSSFEIRFLRNKRVYSYGFTLDDKFILSEWLSLVAGETEKEIFERVTNVSGEVTVVLGKDIPGEPPHVDDKFRALVTVGVRANQLFLATIIKNLDEASQSELVRHACQWFTEDLVIIQPDASFANLARWLATDKQFTAFAGSYLKEVSTGVDALVVDESDKLDANTFSELPFFGSMLKEIKPGEVKTISAPDGDEMIVEKGEGTTVTIRRIFASHTKQDGSKTRLPFNEQSDGTQRLTHLIPALYELKDHPCVYVIDELDRSLHPLLCRQFLAFFIQACRNLGSQLVITTHESNLMDLDILRRDELWFCEKKEGASQLYSLADFKVRTDLKIDKGYLQGRFGAIPFLGNAERLQAQLCAN